KSVKISIFAAKLYQIKTYANQTVCHIKIPCSGPSILGGLHTGSFRRIIATAEVPRTLQEDLDATSNRRWGAVASRTRLSPSLLTRMSLCARPTGALPGAPSTTPGRPV